MIMQESDLCFKRFTGSRVIVEERLISQGAGIRFCDTEDGRFGIGSGDGSSHIVLQPCERVRRSAQTLSHPEIAELPQEARETGSVGKWREHWYCKVSV